MSEPSYPVYLSPAALGRLTIFFLGANLLASLAWAFSILAEIRLTHQAQTVGVSMAEAEAHGSMKEFIDGVSAAAFLLGGMVFVVWLWRLSKNLPSLGCREQAYSPPWTLWGFVIPILNLVRPLQVLTEIWHGSDPDRLANDLSPDGRNQRDRLDAPGVLALWWFLFLVFTLAGRLVQRLGPRFVETTDDLLHINYGWLAMTMIKVICAVIAIRIVLTLDRMQEQRFRLISDPRETRQPLTACQG